MVEEPANVVFGDNINTPSLPKLSKKSATPLFDRQPEERRRTFPSPIAKESDNRLLIFEIASAFYPAFLTALQQCVSNTGTVQSLPPSYEAGSSENPT